MNQIRHEQIQRTGDLASGSALWTATSQGLENQFLPNARSIEERIKAHDIEVVSGSASAGSTIVGNVTKVGNQIVVTKVPTPSGGQATYLNVSFGEVGVSGGYLSEDLTPKTNIEIDGIPYESIDYGISGWICLNIAEGDPLNSRLLIRQPAILLFCNGVSQEEGGKGYLMEWAHTDVGVQPNPFSRIWISSDIYKSGDKLAVLHLTDSTEYKYYLALDKDMEQ